MTANYIYRNATISDTSLIADQRYLMFSEIGKIDDEMLAKARIPYEPWLAERLSKGSYHGILVECDGQVIAGAGMWVGMSAPLPSLGTSDHRRAHIVNVYTHPDHRRQGIAKELMNRLLEIARREGYPVIDLHASDAGRRLYESMGFRATNELRLMM